MFNYWVGAEMFGEEGAAKRPVSERKATANAENAKHSTGPTSAQGKEASRMNAMRTGLYTARPAPILLGDLAEDPTAVQETVSAIVDDLRPRDYLEDMQAIRVANGYVKTGRANKMEAQVLSGPLMTDEGRSLDSDQPFLKTDLDALKQFVAWLTEKRTADTVDFRAIYLMLRSHLERAGVQVGAPKPDPSVEADPAWAQIEVQRIIDTHLGELPHLWAYQQLDAYSDAFSRIAVSRAEHTRGRLDDYERLTRIDQQIGRELQRALAEYRRLQEPVLDDETGLFVETNPPTGGRSSPASMTAKTHLP
jgi:hypothetical protein